MFFLSVSPLSSFLKKTLNDADLDILCKLMMINTAGCCKEIVQMTNIFKVKEKPDETSK